MLLICRNRVGSGFVYGGGRTLILPCSSATSIRPSGRNSKVVGRSKPVARISFWKWSVFATLTITGAEVVVLPDVSVARAVSVCAPLPTVRLSQFSPYGAVVSSAPVACPSTKNLTLATPALSLAFAATATMSLTVALLLGAVIDTVGGVVSPVPEAALNATMCMTQAEPLCVAVALYDPVLVTVLSSVRLPKSESRVVNPEPAAVTWNDDAPAPKIRSLALAVVAEPLLIALPVPTAAAETSSGLIGSIPEYSWM